MNCEQLISQCKKFSSMCVCVCVRSQRIHISSSLFAYYPAFIFPNVRSVITVAHRLPAYMQLGENSTKKLKCCISLWIQLSWVYSPLERMVKNAREKKYNRKKNAILENCSKQKEVAGQYYMWRFDIVSRFLCNFHVALIPPIRTAFGVSLLTWLWMAIVLPPSFAFFSVFRAHISFIGRLHMRWWLWQTETHIE